MGLHKLTIPRWCMGMNEQSILELHVFCDASAIAYGAVTYVVCNNKPNNFSMIMVKSRVVPHSADGWSIPRKELPAVLEGARIAILSNKALLDRAKNVTMWTDSIGVLSWITNDAIRPTQYVHR